MSGSKNSWLLAAAIVVALAVLMFAWRNDIAGRRAEALPPDTVTVTVRDTVTIIAPAPVAEVTLPPERRLLPLWREPTDSVRADSGAVDCVAVAVPMERKVYQGSDYRAVISGAWVSLDTIQVFPRHDITTIRHGVTRNRRWGIGLSVGYGVTPQGLQPWAGVSLTYNLWQF